MRISLAPCKYLTSIWNSFKMQNCALFFLSSLEYFGSVFLVINGIMLKITIANDKNKRLSTKRQFTCVPCTTKPFPQQVTFFFVLFKVLIKQQYAHGSNHRSLLQLLFVLFGGEKCLRHSRTKAYVHCSFFQ